MLTRDLSKSPGFFPLREKPGLLILPDANYRTAPIITATMVHGLSDLLLHVCLVPR